MEEEQIFADGRVRSRKMLVAEKKRPGEAWSACALRGVDEELGVAATVLNETYQTFEEEKRSLSYPGLLSRYVTHAVAVDVPLDAHLGLPGFKPFETSEATGLRHRWGWWEREDCATLLGFSDKT